MEDTVDADLKPSIAKARNKIAESRMRGKLYHDVTHRTKSKTVEVGDWVRVIKPSLKRKGSSIFSLPYKVERVSDSAVLLKDKGWWNKSSIVVLKSGQELFFEREDGGGVWFDVYVNTEENVTGDNNFGCSSGQCNSDQDNMNSESVGQDSTSSEFVVQDSTNELADSSGHASDDLGKRNIRGPKKFDDFVMD